MRASSGLWLFAGLVVACGGGGANGTGSDVLDDGLGGDTPVADSGDVGTDPGRDAPSDDAAVPEDGSPEVPADLPGDVGGDVPPTCEEPCGECQVCQGGQCKDPVPVTVEAEGADQTGTNETFDTPEAVALDTTITGHIGSDGDQDWFRFCASAVGVVTLKVDFQASFDAMGILSMMAPVYSESWAPSLVAMAMSDDTKTECEDLGNTRICPTSMTVKFSVTPVVGAYTFYLTAAGDGQFFPGFDAANPYTITLDFAPGDTLESAQPAVEGQAVGPSDTWDTAVPLTFDADGVAVATSYAWMWNDVDWYQLTLPEDGWLRIHADVGALEDDDANAFVILLDGTLLRVTPTGVEEPSAGGIEFTVGDSPNCPYQTDDYGGIPAGDYYLRLSAIPAANSAPYRVTIEFHPGNPEDGQPTIEGKVVGAADDAATAYDFGTLAAGSSAGVQSYFWQYWDEDWFKVRSPSTGGDLKVELDFQAAYDAVGWTTGCDSRPGLEVWMYLFEEGSLDFPGVAQGYDDDVPKQTITFTTTPDTTYYLGIMSREGWDTDHPYTLTMTMNAN